MYKHTSWLPLEGKLSAKLTDEMYLNLAICILPKRFHFIRPSATFPSRGRQLHIYKFFTLKSRSTSRLASFFAISWRLS